MGNNWKILVALQTAFVIEIECGRLFSRLVADRCFFCLCVQAGGKMTDWER